MLEISQKHQVKVFGPAKCKARLLFSNLARQLCKFKHTNSTQSIHMLKIHVENLAFEIEEAWHWIAVNKFVT